MRRGLFITFEGQECAGKSTQVQLLTEWLESQGHSVLCTREPGGTALAEKIRNLLLDINEESICAESELLLFAASRAQHVRNLILPALAEGKTVLCDRFYDSTTAYQGAARRLPLKVINVLNDFCTADRKPDLTFLLDLTVQESRRRLQIRSHDIIDRMEAEKDSFFEKVRQGFLQIARQEPDRVKCIDATQDIQVIQKIIRTEVQNALSRD